MTSDERAAERPAAVRGSGSSILLDGEGLGGGRASYRVGDEGFLSSTT